MVEVINKTKELSDKIPATPIIMTSKQIDEDMSWAENLKRDSTYKQRMSEISAREWYPTA